MSNTEQPYTPTTIVKSDGTTVNLADVLDDVAVGLGTAGMSQSMGDLHDHLDALTTAAGSLEDDVETLVGEMAPWTSSKYYQAAVPASGCTKTWEPEAQVVLIVNDSTTDEVYVSHSGSGAAPAITVPGAPGGTIDEIPAKVLPGEILPIIETAGVTGLALKAATGKTVNVRILAYWKQ